MSGTVNFETKCLAVQKPSKGSDRDRYEQPTENSLGTENYPFQSLVRLGRPHLGGFQVDDRSKDIEAIPESVVVPVLEFIFVNLHFGFVPEKITSDEYHAQAWQKTLFRSPSIAGNKAGDTLPQPAQIPWPDVFESPVSVHEDRFGLIRLALRGKEVLQAKVKPWIEL